ncbi:MAG: protein translocase subunit SecD [bacterium]|nr:protein translocase subunit SecD [bacterium]
MKQIVAILLLCLLAAVIDMPATVNIGGKTLYRPRLDFPLLGRRVYRDLEIRLGLDLQGGTHLAYEADTSQVESTHVDEALRATRDNIERRINLLGVSEASIQTSKIGDQNRLLVELPGVKDINSALSTIGQTARLEFKESKSATPSAEADFIPTSLTGSDLKFAQVNFDNGKAVVEIEFTPDGAKKFGEITARNLGRPLAISLDGQIVSAPTVQTAITDGRAVITGNFSVDEAKRLSIALNAGALPLPIKVVEQRNIGASLGSESINKSMLAAGVGIVLVWLFMLANYGLRGLLADLALIVYSLLIIAVIKLIPITLTLAGIAGLVLSIGMAVDANILIFERIKEELRWGRSPAVALRLGFLRAWNSIRDSNVSSLITAAILFWFGSGAVRGFALTLSVGILISLFTSITITRTLLKLVYDRN